MAADWLKTVNRVRNPRGTGSDPSRGSSQLSLWGRSLAGEHGRSSGPGMGVATARSPEEGINPQRPAQERGAPPFTFPQTIKWLTGACSSATACPASLVRPRSWHLCRVEILVAQRSYFQPGILMIRGSSICTLTILGGFFAFPFLSMQHDVRNDAARKALRLPLTFAFLITVDLAYKLEH